MRLGLGQRRGTDFPPCPSAARGLWCRQKQAWQRGSKFPRQMSQKLSLLGLEPLLSCPVPTFLQDKPHAGTPMLSPCPWGPRRGPAQVISNSEEDTSVPDPHTWDPTCCRDPRLEGCQGLVTVTPASRLLFWAMSCRWCARWDCWLWAGEGLLCDPTHSRFGQEPRSPTLMETSIPRQGGPALRATSVQWAQGCPSPALWAPSQIGECHCLQGHG